MINFSGSSSADNPLRGLSKDDLGFAPPGGFAKPSEQLCCSTLLSFAQLRKPTSSSATPLIWLRQSLPLASETNTYNYVSL